MADEATRKGVSPEEDDWVDSREAQIEALAAAKDAREAEDFTPVTDGDESTWEEGPTEEGAEAAAPEKEVEDTAEEQATEEAAEEVPEAGVEMVRVVVDGETREVPRDEVVRAYQKHAAADRRLEQATLALRQAAEERKRLEALLQQGGGTAAARPEAPRPAAEIAQQIQALERKLYLEAGSEDEFAKLQAEKATLQDQWYEAKLYERTQFERQRQAQMQQQQSLQALVAEVEKEHADWKDLTLTLGPDGQTRMAPQFEGWLQQQPHSVQWAYMESQDPRDPIRVLTAYKETLRPVASKTLEEKREKKRSIDVVQGGSKRQAPPDPNDDKPPTPSEYIRQLQRQRAQQGMDL